MRDINDEINKLLREKGHWEDRIKELGGPDYRVSNFYELLCKNKTILPQYLLITFAYSNNVCVRSFAFMHMYV